MPARTPRRSTRRRSRAGTKESSPSGATASISRDSALPGWRKVRPVRSAEFVIGGCTQGQRCARGSGGAAARLLGGGRAQVRRPRRLGAGRCRRRGADPADAGAQDQDARRSPRSRRSIGRRPGSSRGWWPKSTSATGRRRGCCARRCLRGCAMTCRRSRSASPWRRAPAAPRLPPPASDPVAEVLQQLAGTGSRLDLTVAGARLRLTNLDRVYWPATPPRRPSPSGTSSAISPPCRASCCRT